jgi:hypothetical protein
MSGGSPTLARSALINAAAPQSPHEANLATWVEIVVVVVVGGFVFFTL